MKKFKNSFRVWGSGIGLALVASCGVSDDHSGRIDVSEPNELGVSTLQIDRLQDNGNAVFVLTAFSAQDRELASVRLTTGEIAGITEWLPGAGELGSEVEISVGALDSRTFTRSRSRVDLTASGRDPAITSFLGLATVGATLAKEANVYVRGVVDADSETPLYGYCDNGQPQPCEVYKNTATCDPSIMNSSPVAKQCAYTTNDSMGIAWTNHVGVKGTGSNPPTFAQSQTTVVRFFSIYGACRTDQGSSICTGTDCFFGPNGFGVPSATPPTGTQYGWTRRNGTIGTGGFYASQQFTATQSTSFFGDVNGQFTPGQNCCKGQVQSTAQGCCAGTLYTLAGHTCCNGVVVNGGCQATGAAAASPIGDDDPGDTGAWDY